MKKFILAIVVALSVTSANAAKQKPYCDTIYELAEAIMTSRQNGASLKEMRKIVKTDLGKALTLWAYEKPMYSYAALKQEAINSFAKQAFYGCKSIRKE